jgi:hypothetical protein
MVAYHIDVHPLNLYNRFWTVHFSYILKRNNCEYTLRTNYEETSQRRRPNIRLLRDNTRSSR